MLSLSYKFVRGTCSTLWKVLDYKDMFNEQFFPLGKCYFIHVNKMDPQSDFIQYEEG